MYATVMMLVRESSRKCLGEKLEVYATGLRCIKCGATYSTGERFSVCPKCHGLFEVEYDFDLMQEKFQKSELQRNTGTGIMAI